jgi:uncharacterized protein YbjT (DUF2867 family)
VSKIAAQIEVVKIDAGQRLGLQALYFLRDGYQKLTLGFKLAEERGLIHLSHAGDFARRRVHSLTGEDLKGGGENPLRGRFPFRYSMHACAHLHCILKRMTEQLSAVIAGSTGAVGGNVTAALLASARFEVIVSVGRRLMENLPSSPRFSQHVVDMSDPSSYETLLTGYSCAFCTLGIGQASKVSREELYRVDVRMAIDFASACRRQGIRHFTLMTAVGANTRSKFYYVRIKGELEEKLIALGFARTSIFRPSMLLTPENRYGFTQGVMLRLFPIIQPLLFGPLRKFRGIRVEDLGRAMVTNAEQPASNPSGVEIFEWDDFEELLRPQNC